MIAVPPREPLLAASPLLTAAAGRRRATPLALVLPVTAAVWFLSVLAVSVLARDGEAVSAVASAGYLAPAIVAGYGLRALLTVAWVGAVERRGWRTLGFPAAGAVASAARGAGLGLGLLALVVAALGVSGGVALADGDARLQGAAALPGVLLMLPVWAVQATAEEVLYRGFVLQTVAGRLVPWAGVLVSSAVFAAAHLDAWGNPLALVNLALFGCFAAVWALREGNLWAICGLHAAWNWGLGNLTGLTVSGSDIPGGAVVDLRATGPEALTGGAFGVESSLLVTLLFASLTAALLWRASRDRRR